MINKIKQFITQNNLSIYTVSVLKGDKTEDFSPRPCNPCNNSYSIAKVFTLTAIGMLWDEGSLAVSQKIGELFDCPAPWQNVTVENAIAHKTGLGAGCLDIDSEIITEKDFLSVLFSLPLKYEAGTKYVYSDGAYYLLSRVVTAVSGEKTDDFLMKRLFSPMNVREMAWSKCPLGYSIGATGLYIRPSDICKLGQAYINGGVYGGKRYFSSAWADFVLQNGYELSTVAPNAYGKAGMNGQYLLADKSTNTVNCWQGTSSADSKMLREFIIQNI